MTIDKGSKEWRELTFSQREGEAPLPEALQVGKLTDKFRQKIWFYIDRSVSKGCPDGFLGDILFSDFNGGPFWKSFNFYYQLNILGKPHDGIETSDAYLFKKWLKDTILHKDYHELLTMLEYMLRYPDISQTLVDNIKKCFEFAPYFIDQGNPLCIVPATSEEMKECTQQALNNINQSTLTGAKYHLSNAAQALNSDDFAAAIRESIHAVESAARTIDPEASKTLGPALDSLEKNGILKHPALKGAFQKLYGYTSDTEGIRHPLIKKDDSDVGFDEAIFMYAACVSFVDYLVSKKKQMDE